MSFALKPDAQPALVADKLATIAHELGAAGARGAGAEAGTLAQAAQHVAAEAFLDPGIAESLHADLSAQDQLSLAADQLATAIRQIAQSIPAEVPSDDPSAVWPLEVVGGEHVLHFRLVRALREGGMGTVHLAWDERLDRNVVLKRLGAAQEPLEGRQRLEREARAAARLRHPNIVTIYALEYLGNEPILVQEYVDGDDLDALVGMLGPDDVLRVAEAIAAGLASAHANGIMHRDLKPRNVRVRADGTPVILDFGLGKAFLATPEDKTQVGLTKPGIVMGTPHYMAPEQWTTAIVTPAADVFAFGVLLFELLAGQAPFDAGTPNAAYAAFMRGNMPPIDAPDVPAGIEELIRACLAPAAQARPTMADVAERLAGIRTGTLEASGDLKPIYEAGILSDGAERSPWFAFQAERGHKGIATDAVTIEVSVAFDRALGDCSVAELFRRLEQLSRNDVPIGRVGKNGLTRISDGGYARGSYGTRKIFWSARYTGEFFFLADVPLLPTGAIPVETLLRDVVQAFAYIARYAQIMGVADDESIFFAVELHNVNDRLIGAAEWNARLTTTLTELHKGAHGTISSALVAAPQALREDLPTVLKLLFDDLLSAFPFITISAEYYLARIRETLGTDSRW